MPFVLSKNIKIKTISKQLEKKIIDHGMRILRERLERGREVAIDTLRQLIEEAIRGSVVYKALSGQYEGSVTGKDLPAEFGLRNEDLQGLVDRMMNILMAVVRLNYKHGQLGANTTVEITAEALDPKNYTKELTDYPFRYTSSRLIREGKGKDKTFSRAYTEEIPWMEWLLNAQDSLTNQLKSLKDYGIIYHLREFEEKASRSGRALMTKDKFRAFNFPYDMPKIALPKVKGSQNFIEDIALDKRFRAAITKQIEKEVFRILRRHQKLPTRLLD